MQACASKQHQELARAVLRLIAQQAPIQGASDHGTHEAIYLPDPDGIGIELAADRPREQWPTPAEEFGRGGPQPLDTWRGDAVPPAPEHTTGLRNWTVRLDTAAEVEAVRSRVAAAGIAVEAHESGFTVRDPWEIAVRIERA